MGVTTSGQSGPGGDGNEGVLSITQSSSFTRASPTDCLMSYPGSYLPTPPLGQDMTQGQFLSGV